MDFDPSRNYMMPTSKPIADKMNVGDIVPIETMKEAYSLSRCIRAQGFASSVKTCDEGFMVGKLKKKIQKAILTNATYSILQTHKLTKIQFPLCIESKLLWEIKDNCKDLNRAFPHARHTILINKKEHLEEDSI